MTFISTVRTTSAVAAAEVGAGLGERLGVDVGEDDAGAFAQQPLGGGWPMPPAPPVTSAIAAGEALRLRHALELGLFEQPVFDVEGFLLGQAAIVDDASRRRASR